MLEPHSVVTLLVPSVFPQSPAGAGAGPVTQSSRELAHLACTEPGLISPPPCTPTYNCHPNDLEVQAGELKFKVILSTVRQVFKILECTKLSNQMSLCFNLGGTREENRFVIDFFWANISFSQD